MNGDIIRFNGKSCKAEIQGSEGAYRTIDGKCINCATGTNGFLIDLETGYRFRAKWDKKTEIIKQAITRNS